MNRFFRKIIVITSFPAFWILISWFIQNRIYEPIGNPEAHFQLNLLEDSGFVFIGPSVFHQRIDSKYLEERLNQRVQLITSNGQSTLESFALAKMTFDRTPNARVIIAGHDLKVTNVGLHQCWACSQLPMTLMISEWSEIAHCFWFDSVIGLLAGLVPPQAPLPFALNDEQLLSDQHRRKSHDTFSINKGENLEEFSQNFLHPQKLPRLHLYKYLAQKSENFTLLIPPNGLFQACPPGISCLEPVDSTWLNLELWLDKSHINSLGASKFTFWLEETIECYFPKAAAL